MHSSIEIQPNALNNTHYTMQYEVVHYYCTIYLSYINITFHVPLPYITSLIFSCSLYKFPRYRSYLFFIYISKFTLNTSKIEGMWSQSDIKLPMNGRIIKLRYYLLFAREKYLMVHYLGRFQRGLNMQCEVVHYYPYLSIYKHNIKIWSQLWSADQTVPDRSQPHRGSGSET